MAKLMTMLQLVGAVLGIPVGLASGYSVYRANFSVETTCATMRSSIVGTLDKNVDPTTLRMLVRRDVETFERSCGAIDPDATAAFKHLLDAGSTTAKRLPVPAPAAAAVRTKSPPIEPSPSVRETTKPAAKTASARSEPESAKHSSSEPHTGSDAEWIAAVRHALMTHAPEPADKGAKSELAPAAPADEPAPRHTLSLPEPLATATVPTAPPVHAPAAVATAPRQSAPAPAPQIDHPVPPAPIPDDAAALEPAPQPRPEAATGPHLGAWIAQMPIVGQIFGTGGSPRH